jgi:hypothetical protein
MQLAALTDKATFVPPYAASQPTLMVLTNYHWRNNACGFFPSLLICTLPRHRVKESATMAKITFTPQEAVSLLASNRLLPEAITDIKVDGDTLSFQAVTGLPLTPPLPVSIKYLGFENGTVTLEATVAFLRRRWQTRPRLSG